MIQCPKCSAEYQSVRRFCHGPIPKNIVGVDCLFEFDALSVYKKHTDIFDIDAVPEQERKAAARQVADFVLTVLRSA